MAERAQRARRPRPKAWIDVDGCTGCEWCVDFCPVDCIDKIDDPYYAGDGTHQELHVRDIQRLIREAGREPIERDTLYRPVRRDRETDKVLGAEPMLVG